MELFSPQLLILGIGLLSGALLCIPLRRFQRKVTPQIIQRSELTLISEVTQLKEQLHLLEKKYHAQLEFFVSFPEVVKALTAALSQEQVTSACSRGISALLHTHSIAILLIENKTHLRLVDGAGFPKHLRYSLACPISETGFWDILAYRGISNLQEEPSALAFLMEHGLPSELAVPIWYGEQRLGLITVAKPQGELQVIRRMLAMMADLTGVGLHAAGQVSQIRNSAERDALTGLANRRALMARLTFELQRCISYESCTSLAMIDVDHFKQYNDQNGHQAGDQVLQTIAKLMSATTRRTDLVARYGGEEFTVILTGTDQEQAFRHAERIRKTIVEHNFPHGETQPLGRVTISIGIATFPHDATTVESLFETADKALYRAKHTSRNRVVCYNKEPRE